MAKDLSEEFVGCFAQPHEIVSEVALAEMGGVAVINCTGFGERPWDTEVTEANLPRWQSAVESCPARPQEYCNDCPTPTTIEDLKVEFSNSQK